ncbi:DUF349 domain-containing protein [Tepidimonas charontis]|uniref:DUF349 domain-containing protein n=1 Tax=Tepidimonas charontis TaxID=2267262 RepID=UPI001F268857|nr:DUF349 domain-containing protein [Tepidimonas charontis]
MKPTPSDLDLRTGGVLSAPNAAERSARLRAWLDSDPPMELLVEVYRELAHRDKGAAKQVRERLDECRRARAQDALAAQWAERAQALLAAPRLNLADAMAWLRDAAKDGAPLSREPLAGLRQQLTERMKAIEDLQTRVLVEREAASLLVQRIELLSTKPWADALAARDGLAQDVAAWQERAAALQGSPHWGELEPRHAAPLQTAQQQLTAVWTAFQAALTQAQAAAADVQASLPGVPVWDDEIRAARGESAAPAAVPKAVMAVAQAALLPAIEALERELGAGHTKAMVRYAGELRHAVKVHGRHAGPQLEARAHAALAKAKELEDWQRWRADQLREELLAKAEALTQGTEDQRPNGRQLQEAIRHLREQWKLTDQGGTSNHALWKRFDEACNRAYQTVQAWRRELAAQHAAAEQARRQLIDEVRAWTAAHASDEDWRSQVRDLHAFAERWRQGGHVSEKRFAELQTQWKEAMAAAHARLEAAQADSVARRQALIAEAQALAAEPRLRLDAIKALQQRWQAEAQRVPLERRKEQKLWEAFRQPIDAAFARKNAEREQTQAALSALDAAVMQAVRALEQACAGDDAQQIRAAMAALRAAASGEGTGRDGASDATGLADAAAAVSAQHTTAATAEAADAVAPAAGRPLVARRGDDRPGAVAAAAAPARQGRTPRPAREGVPPRPRLGEAAFRAQRQALEAAEARLRQLAARAHGEALTALLQAWAQRDADRIPPTQQLGGRQAAAARPAWVRALQQGGGTAEAADVALLRLEIAADLPTPAEWLAQRRQLQLQLLTRRHEPGPAETWGQDVAQILASAHDTARERRLQAALKVLLRR